MRKRSGLYALTAIATAAFVGCAIAAFWYAKYFLGAVACVCCVSTVFCLAGEIVEDNYFVLCDKLFSERKYEEEKRVLDKVQHNHFIFPFVRTNFYRLAIRNAAARADMETCGQYIEFVRHGGEPAPRYRTAFFATLMKLDEGDVEGARAEYEEFRTRNKNVPVYQEEIRSLNAVFARLFSHKDEPLPASVVECPYPVMKRILGKHFEYRAAESLKDWGEEA